MGWALTAEAPASQAAAALDNLDRSSVYLPASETVSDGDTTRQRDLTSEENSQIDAASEAAKTLLAESGLTEEKVAIRLGGHVDDQGQPVALTVNVEVLAT